MSRVIKKIVVHHSVTPRDLELEKSIKSFDNNHAERLHKTKNRLGFHIAYHYVIAWNGSYKKTRMWGEIWYHASNKKINNESIWICLTWNFDTEKPTKAQYASLNKIIDEIKVVYPDITIHWHNEYASKSCPWHNFDFTQLQNIIMLFYEKLRKDNYEKTDKEKRVFKEPKAFIDRIKDLSIDEKFSELTYLVAILAEKLGK